MDVEHVVLRLVKDGLASADDLRGCNAQQITEVEHTFAIALPAAYRTFLSRIGLSAGQFLWGTDFLFPAILELRGQAERLLALSGTRYALKPSDFVFAAHQGYQFLFFTAGTEADPPVYRYMEGDMLPERVADAFSHWLWQASDDEVRAHRALQEKGASSSG
jgi:hypothetical protein